MSGSRRGWPGLGPAALAFVGGLCALALTSTAHAQFNTGNLSGVYVPVGLNLGIGGRSQDGPGPRLGAELSVVAIDGHAEELPWLGLYADVVLEPVVGSTQLSLGPEAGLGPFGVDAGVTARHLDGDWRFGGRGRVLLTISLLSVYLGAGGDADGFNGEVGVLLKYPLGL